MYIIVDARKVHRINIPYTSTDLTKALNYYIDNKHPEVIKYVKDELGIVRANNYTEDQKRVLKEIAEEGEGMFLVISHLQ